MRHQPSLARRLRPLPWPLPALLTWATGWSLWAAAGAAGAAPGWALAAALTATLAAAWPCGGVRRRLIAAAGFPLSAWALGLGAGWPPWLWLLLLAPLLAAYPLRAWRDAPFFPTPAGALAGLAAVTGTPRRVLDAGCGLGHGLAALQRLWPQAELHGIEWSPLLAWLAARRCRRARVVRGDMWAASWAGCDLVYLFQRPESMARAWAKAERELAPDAWLVSLEFAVPGRTPWASVQGPGRRPLWIYRPGADKDRSTGAPSGR
jgi:SAM-dependent methyltransferase